ncbi:hypothetical protein G3I44_15195 [Halogeometricum borinquense]|uniref:Metal-dependent hydrolase n=1 Tax=Halogeometricum borinquense TaxID=60847 RepID=A0A6C0ULR1_9EURY|nr:metal-dependent hydrolase [Halogeometricum borinquense]QIB75523.1 hypothetical protein G3I44_15195 [Halogeometricum borinquense]
MYPIGHLALAYLSYVLYARVTDIQLPHGRPLAVLVVASQLPDLVDKPLVYIGVLSSGRSLAHSLVVLVPVLLLVGTILVHLERRPLWPILSVGTLSHVLGDSYRLVLTQQWTELRFLLWPVFPAINYPNDGIPPWVRLLNHGFGLGMRVQFSLAIVAVAVWAWSRHRHPVKR